jgi:endonuclease/exonuclease/phosphatase family metal-dependent hydrolase
MRWACLFALLAASCTHEGNFSTDAGPDADPLMPYPPPRSDLVPPVGSESTLELATWNIENFPASLSLTPSIVADVITSLDLDVIVVEEIASDAAWDELLLRLREHDGILSTHQYTPDSYQKIGIIYRSSLVTAGPPSLLFTTDESSFPRPPLSVTITVDDATIEVIGVHLKAGREFQDAQRRTDAVVALDARLRTQVDGGGEAEIVLLGDYNERVLSESDRAVLAPLLTAPDRYTVRTEPLALSGGTSFLGFGGTFIDHITTTAALDARWSTARVEVPPLHVTVPSYQAIVSDHLPVVLIAPR